jgi:hypothetical protein
VNDHVEVGEDIADYAAHVVTSLQCREDDLGGSRSGAADMAVDTLGGEVEYWRVGLDNTDLCEVNEGCVAHLYRLE